MDAVLCGLGKRRGASVLNGWTLGITAVSEPVNVPLGVFGGLFAVAGLVKIVRRSKAARNNNWLKIRVAG